MLQDDVVAFVEMGERIANVVALWAIYSEKSDDGYVLNEEGRGHLKAVLHDLLELAQRLELSNSMKLIIPRLSCDQKIPIIEKEFDIIFEVIKIELENKIFLFVPQAKADYWEKSDILSNLAKDRFPKAASELRCAGNSYAASLPEGSIYYSMRALEHGLRALAQDVGKVFNVQNWQNIINEIESQIENWRKNGIPEMDKENKDVRLQFISEVAKEFAYFKDGWRNYVAHAKVPYTEHQALTVLRHVSDFIERLSEKMAE